MRVRPAQTGFTQLLLVRDCPADLFPAGFFVGGSWGGNVFKGIWRYCLPSMRVLAVYGDKGGVGRDMDAGNSFHSHVLTDMGSGIAPKQQVPLLRGTQRESARGRCE
jgi:hypothetical protein